MKFVTRIEPEKEEPYTVIFTTDDFGKYRLIEDECRKMIGHLQPMTNADKYFRNATDEEIAKWIHRHDCRTNLYGYDNEEAILEWLKQEVPNAELD